MQVDDDVETVSLSPADCLLEVLVLPDRPRLGGVLDAWDGPVSNGDADVVEPIALDEAEVVGSDVGVPGRCIVEELMAQTDRVSSQSNDVSSIPRRDGSCRDSSRSSLATDVPMALQALGSQR